MKKNEYQAPNSRIIFVSTIKLLMNSKVINKTSTGFEAGFDDDEDMDLDGE